MSSEAATSPTVRDTILEKALDVFVRYGYRKTNMEDVASAAGISRQTIYLHFKSKEALFRAGTEFLFDGALEAVEAALESDVPIDESLVTAFDEWHGRFVEAFLNSPHIDEIMEASGSLAGDAVAAKEERFVALLAGAIKRAGIRFDTVQLSPKDAASLLEATSRGYKHSVASREEYRQKMRTAVRVLCAAGTIAPRRSKTRSN